MLANKKIIVVLPAYNAAETLKQTYDEIPHDIVDDIITEYARPGACSSE